MGAKVVTIAGFLPSTIEFQENRIHIGTPEGFCKECYSNHRFDIFDKYWCPENKNFECTMTITFDMVREKIEELL